MNALLLTSDTLTVKVVEATNAAAVIVDKTTNCCDVKIAKTICCAIVTITVITAITILLWHLIQKIADGCKHRREIAKEKEEKTNKVINEYNEKYLSFLKDITAKENKIKDLDSAECKKYINALEAIVKTDSSKQ